MMSINELRKLLGEKANEYSEEELEEIRKDAYTFANLAFDVYKENPRLLDKY